MTKFFLLYRKIKIQIAKTINLIVKELSLSTPAGKIIILATNAANVAYATQLNHSKVFDLALTFSDVRAPENLEINVATDVTIIAKIIILISIFAPK